MRHDRSPLADRDPGRLCGPAGRHRGKEPAAYGARDTAKGTRLDRGRCCPRHHRRRVIRTVTPQLVANNGLTAFRTFIARTPTATTSTPKADGVRRLVVYRGDRAL